MYIYTTLSTVFQKLVDRWCILNRECIAVVLEKFESMIDPPLQEEDFSLAQVLERGKKMGDDSWKGGGKKSWGGPPSSPFSILSEARVNKSRQYRKLADEGREREYFTTFPAWLVGEETRGIPLIRSIHL